MDKELSIDRINKQNKWYTVWLDSGRIWDTPRAVMGDMVYPDEGSAINFIKSQGYTEPIGDKNYVKPDADMADESYMYVKEEII